MEISFESGTSAQRENKAKHVYPVYIDTKKI